MADWQAAQSMEANTWREEISASVVGVVDEFCDALELERVLQAHGVSYGRAIDIGIGPMGVGWIGLFGKGTPDELFGVEPLERLQVHTGQGQLDDFIRATQERITYVRCRAEDTEFAPGSFDLVVCDNVVDHAEDPHVVLRRCHQLIADGGTLAFGVNVFSTLGYQKWNRFTRRRDPRNPNVIMHPHSFTQHSALSLLASTGWRVKSFQRLSAARRLAGSAYRFRALAEPVRGPAIRAT